MLLLCSLVHRAQHDLGSGGYNYGLNDRNITAYLCYYCSLVHRAQQYSGSGGYNYDPNDRKITAQLCCYCVHSFIERNIIRVLADRS